MIAPDRNPSRAPIRDRRLLVEWCSPSAGDDDRSRLVDADAAPDDRGIALRTHANLLRAGWNAAAGKDGAFDPWTDATAREVGLVVGWSGTLGAEFFADAPQNWLPPGRRAFDASLSALLPFLRDAGVWLLVQPHARHSINDVPSTLALMRRENTGNLGVALSPMSLLTSPMLRDIDEHLHRIFSALGSIASLVILEDGAPSEGTDDDAPPTPLPVTVPLGQGMLPRKLVMELIETHVDPKVPLAVLSHDASDLESVRRWIGGT